MPFSAYYGKVKLWEKPNRRWFLSQLVLGGLQPKQVSLLLPLWEFDGMKITKLAARENAEVLFYNCFNGIPISLAKENVGNRL